MDEKWSSDSDLDRSKPQSYVFILLILNSFLHSLVRNAGFILTGSPRGPGGPTSPLIPGSPGSPYRETDERFGV